MSRMQIISFHLTLSLNQSINRSSPFLKIKTDFSKMFYIPNNNSIFIQALIIKYVVKKFIYIFVANENWNFYIEVSGALFDLRKTL